MAPSPTAEATRFIESRRTSPAANTPGTLVSSALEAMRQVVVARYSPADWNIYAAQASDGDNYTEDSDRCASLIRTSLNVVEERSSGFWNDPRLTVLSPGNPFHCLQATWQPRQPVHTVYVPADRCAADAADFVFATRSLVAHCAAGGLPHRPFRDFHEVMAHFPR
mgnify:CR=1 FL=1